MSRGSGPGLQTVIAAQEGDEGALENLLSAYLPLVYNIVGRALNGHADVDDVVQETMIRVVRSVRDLRDPGAFRSWLVPWPSARCTITARPGRPRRCTASAPMCPIPRPTSWT